MPVPPWMQTPAEQLRDTVEYMLSTPFPHLAFDNVFDPERLRKVVRNIEELPTLDRQDIKFQTNKYWLSDYTMMGDDLRNLILWFNGSTFVSWLADLTKIPDLIPDMSYEGGGVHITEAGGKLGVHTDFNVHPTLRLHRRINVLLFLNENWQSEWEGKLELWGRQEGTGHLEVKQTFAPIFNRMVVFNITDQSYHGMPTPLACPSGMTRMSLALYYYTADRPEEERAPAHMARWFTPDGYGQLSPGRFVQ